MSPHQCLPILITLLLTSYIRCEEITLFPNQDTTLYEEALTNENGLGAHLFSGVNNGGDSRRALLSFDIAGNLPSDVLITRATLSMTVNRVAPPEVADTFGLHPVTRSWEEGQVEANREGRGQPSTGGGASWSSSGNESWATAGGDFLEAASASVLIGPTGTYAWESTDQLVADVQSWLVDPSTNFGWALVGTEVAEQSAKRLLSSQNENESMRPALRLEFEIAETLQGDYDGDGELLANDVNLLCEAVLGGENPSAFDLNADGSVNLEDQRVWVEDVRGTFFGDANLDGRVSFEDFLVQSSNFAQTPARGGWENGDHDCDGEVNFPDFLQMSANFGSEAEATAANVPEPGCCALLLTVVSLALRRRKL